MIKDYFISQGSLSFLLTLLLLSGCTDKSYEKGYEAAWQYEEEPDYWASQEEKDGYVSGSWDSDMYDEGFDDGLNKKRPKYIKDEFYMDGYKDGKNSR
jgi:hypothetical protein